MIQVTVLFHTFPRMTAAKTTPRVPKLGYKGGRAPQHSARGTLATSGAGVVCHIWSFWRKMGLLKKNVFLKCAFGRGLF